MRMRVAVKGLAGDNADGDRSSWLIYIVMITITMPMPTKKRRAKMVKRLSDADGDEGAWCLCGR